MELPSILTLTPTRIKGTSHEDHNTFMVISEVLHIPSFFCSLRYPVRNAYVPLYIVIFDLPGSTIFSHIIPY